MVNWLVGVILRNLSDADVIRIMADESDEEYGSSAYVIMEAILAVLEAYAAGNITLGKVPAKTKTSLICSAPSVIPATDDDAQSPVHHRYTRNMVAEFLGWTRKREKRVQPNYRCQVAFQWLEVVDRELAKEDDKRRRRTGNARLARA